MKQRQRNKYTLFLLCLLFAACTGTRQLPAGEKLYTGADVELESMDPLKKRKKRFIKNTAQESIRPKPNKSFLGMRPKLWRYLKAGENPKGKFRKWLQKTGEAPVLMSQIKPGATTAIIDASLFNIGIFKSLTEFKIVERKRTGKVIYTSRIHKPYTVKELRVAVYDENINRIILLEKEQTLLRPGSDYNLNQLKNERVRIDALLKDQGYFYFDPDYLLFKADTTESDRTVTFKVTLKDSIPKNALSAYRINNVYIDQEYSIDDEAAETKRDTTHYDNAIFLGKESEIKIRRSVILRSVYLKKQELYSRKNHNITLNRLMSMGNFKFVRIKFADSDTSASGYLDVTILMTLMPKRTVRAEVDLISKSNNYTGPRANISYHNRNTFNGAELLNVSMAGSYETQLSGKYKNLYSYSLNPQIELYVPNFLLPFKVKTSSMYIPKTRFSLSYNYLKRVRYFDMRTMQFIYGYRWKEDIIKEHELNPINISYTSLGNRSAEFNELLASNAFLRKSYEEQFIAGANYSYTFNEQVLEHKRTQFFVHLTGELAGNAFSLANLIAGQKVTPDNPRKIAGSIYSQYVRSSVDGRVYFNFIDKNKFVIRVYAGAGKPYKNSSTLPYTKQFFSGGPNSIRAFHINSVGPGANYQENTVNAFLQLGGDIKLETNAEYRFAIFKFFKGAVFADAGNVWLLKSNPANPSGAFVPSTFYQEIAVGAGVGLRVDVSFFILRFDLAIPLRKPWLPEGERWVTNQISFGNPSWRSDNLILNVAIGYPF
jgi:hypothetical protein